MSESREKELILIKYRVELVRTESYILDAGACGVAEQGTVAKVSGKNGYLTRARGSEGQTQMRLGKGGQQIVVSGYLRVRNLLQRGIISDLELSGRVV